MSYYLRVNFSFKLILDETSKYRNMNVNIHAEAHKKYDLDKETKLPRPSWHREGSNQFLSLLNWLFL